LLSGDEDGLSGIQFETKDQPFDSELYSQNNRVIFEIAIQQLQEYFQKKRTEFHLALNLKGTEFQLKVWNILKTIPYGTTCSYLDVAIKLGDRNMTRAVGGANNKNPIPIIIPCHRVIGQSGNMVGFASGIGIKSQLLQLESKQLELF
jgi:O-6-methylguanine DNA methyltransferase